MNREWSEKNKRMQSLLTRTGFPEAKEQLLSLRSELFSVMPGWRETLRDSDWCAMPFMNAKGYHSKSVAYSIWHIMRIEDITVNTLIRNREQVFFSEDFDKKTGASVITTGNELSGSDIGTFSASLDISALYGYAAAVREETDRWLNDLSYEDLKQRFTDSDRQRIRDTRTVSTDESAVWLIDYWCGKDVSGLIRMPLSRHWIMHIEAAERIIEKLHKQQYASPDTEK